MESTQQVFIVKDGKVHKMSFARFLREEVNTKLPRPYNVDLNGGGWQVFYNYGSPASIIYETVHEAVHEMLQSIYREFTKMNINVYKTEQEAWNSQ
jgi:hypothetical protein